MSDARRRLVEGLEQGAGARVASSLSQAGSAPVMARAHRAQRVRLAWQTGAAAAAVVAVASGVAVWWGPTGAFEPVSPDPSASASAGLTSADADVSEPAWLSDTDWSCGAAFDLPQGVTVSDTSARSAGTVSAELVDFRGDPGVTVIGPEEESWGASWSVSIDDFPSDLATMSTRTVVTQGHRILGVSNPMDMNVAEGPLTGSGTFVTLGAGPVDAEVPFPGDCGSTTFQMDDGEYELHLVVQLGLVDGSVAQYVDPAGPQSLTYTGQEERLSWMDESLLAEPPAAWSEPVTSWVVEGAPLSEPAVPVVGSPPGLSCGEEWTLTQGGYLHDADYGALGPWVAAAPIAWTAADEGALTPGQADVVDPPLLTWVVDQGWTDGDDSNALAQAVAVRDGVIVGASAVAATGPGGVPELWVEMPVPGSCGDDVVRRWQSTSVAEDAATVVHLVVVRYRGDEPYATFVDPGGTVTVREALGG